MPLECVCLEKYNDEAIFGCCNCSQEEHDRLQEKCERDWNGWWDCYFVSSCDEWEDIDDCDEIEGLDEELDCYD